MLTLLGKQSTTCGGLSRRKLMQVGGAGLLGLSLPRLMAAEEATPFVAARAKSVIFLFLFGGPSQLETFDMKPDARREIRGPFRPIPTRSGEFEISELLPLHADIADRFSLVRTCHHD